LPRSEKENLRGVRVLEKGYPREWEMKKSIAKGGWKGVTKTTQGGMCLPVSTHHTLGRNHQWLKNRDFGRT